MHILDIGGGFTGGCFDESGTVQLGQVPSAVNAALDTHFPDPSIKVDCSAQFANAALKVHLADAWCQRCSGATGAGAPCFQCGP